MPRQKKNVTSRGHVASGSSKNCNPFNNESLYERVREIVLSQNLVIRKNAVPISVTTRGVGFLTNEIYRSLNHNCISFNPLQLYRLSLAQFEYRCSVNIERMSTPCYRNPFDVFRYTMINYNIERYKALGPICSLVNSIGIFEAFGVTYYPMLPILDIGHPLGVTFSNLRETVEALSDPEKSSQEVRKRFYDYNSIPNAVWSEKPDQTDTEEKNFDSDWPLLMNADEIMPNRDVGELLSEDYRAICVSMSWDHPIINVSKTENCYFGQLDYSQPGDPSVFTSCYMMNHRLSGDANEANSAEPPFSLLLNTLRNTSFWAARRIEADEIKLGALLCTGEIEQSCEEEPYQCWAAMRFKSCASISVGLHRGHLS